jgi:4-amino-4-deoxy-L-arabinose transferase-like glycosyltransferase
MKNSKINGLDRDYLALALILIVGIALRAAAIAEINHIPESDELAYKSMALNLITGNGIVDNMGNRAMYNVGYPLFVLAPVFFLFGEALFIARLANLVLGATAIALCYLVAKEAGAGRPGRLLAAAVWALYLPASVFGVYLAKENLMVPLMLGVMWCALRLVKEPSSNVAIGCGALFGLLALTGNAALSLSGVVIHALVFTPASLRQRLALSVSILVAAIVVSAPWIVRNTQVIGAPVLNTNGGFNLYLGNNPAATGMFVSISDTPIGPTWEALRKIGEVQASETLKREAISWAKEHPTKFAALAFKKAGYFWMPPFHEGKGQASSAEAIVRVMWAIQFIFLVAAAVGSLIITHLRNKQLAILWLAIACYMAVHMLFYVLFRYREPIMPVLGVIAALTLEALYVKKGMAGLTRNKFSLEHA